MNRLISIHAPPRGATVKEWVFEHYSLISIHAPPRGATCAGAWRLLGLLDFNSRPSARGDAMSWFRSGWRTFQFTPLREGRRPLVMPRSVTMPISIHAPPRGATTRFIVGEKAVTISIHAPPRGATAKDMQFLQIFCSTLTNQHGLTIMPRNLSRLFW